MAGDERRDDVMDRAESAAEARLPVGPSARAATGGELSAESFPSGSDPLSSDGREHTPGDVDASQPTVKSHVAPPAPRDSPTAPPVEDPTIELRYQRLRFHALGGLGCIFRAADEKLHRDVALKFIRPEAADNPLHNERFCVEAEITARLDHPGVVPVYGIGRTAEGKPFYAMRFIQGETLDEAIRRFHDGEAGNKFNRRALEFRTLLNRFVALCNTIGYAHNRGIVHRDIKPANVMLGRYGETVVLDWGLALPVGRDERARASGEQTLMPTTGGDSSGSSSGSGAGTPAYMSPEQARGELHVGPASDVYSLGTTLYKMLTGRAPFRGNSLNEILDEVRSGSYIAPREMSPRVPPALEAVCVKAMSFDPRDRYASALDLARDVERWLADEPPRAYFEPASEKIVRWARRHRLATLVAAGAMLAIVLVAGLAAWRLGRLANRERDARVVADVARAAADESREESLELSAKFAARTIAAEIDRRWWILESEANDGELRTLLESAADPQTQPAATARLQEWIQDRFRKHADSGRAASWFVQDAKGIQVARWPAGESVGKSWAFRDYFHGQGRDLSEDATDPIVPIREPYRSIVTRSTVTGNLMVAFSVPVWKGQPRASDVLGVLAMTVELHRFGVLDGLGRERLAVLVDTGSDWIEGDENTGLVLHHRTFADAPRGEGTARRVLRCDPKLIETMRAAGTRETASGLLRAHRDPADAAGDPPWLAAWEPVVLRGRPEHLSETGWVVIVQERLDGAP
ncbi:MAG: serine/threonine protein kinase [Planctomycetaceae bacterium]